MHSSLYCRGCYLVTKSCPTLLQPCELQPTRLLCLWDFPGKNTREGCHFILQGISPKQGSNTHLLHQQADSLPLSHQGSLWFVENYFHLNFSVEYGPSMLSQFLCKKHFTSSDVCILREQLMSSQKIQTLNLYSSLSMTVV